MTFDLLATPIGIATMVQCGWASFKVLQQKRTTSTSKDGSSSPDDLLRYWILSSIFTFSESFLDSFLALLPFYTLAKLCVTVWLFINFQQASRAVFTLLDPTLRRCKARVDNTISTAMTGIADAVSFWAVRVAGWFVCATIKNSSDAEIESLSERLTCLSQVVKSERSQRLRESVSQMVYLAPVTTSHEKQTNEQEQEQETTSTQGDKENMLTSPRTFLARQPVIYEEGEEDAEQVETSLQTTLRRLQGAAQKDAALSGASNLQKKKKNKRRSIF